MSNIHRANKKGIVEYWPDGNPTAVMIAVVGVVYVIGIIVTLVVMHFA